MPIAPMAMASTTMTAPAVWPRDSLTRVWSAVRIAGGVCSAAMPAGEMICVSP